MFSSKMNDGWYRCLFTNKEYIYSFILHPSPAIALCSGERGYLLPSGTVCAEVKVICLCHGIDKRGQECLACSSFCTKCSVYMWKIWAFLLLESYLMICYLPCSVNTEIEVTSVDGIRKMGNATSSVPPPFILLVRDEHRMICSFCIHICNRK